MKTFTGEFDKLKLFLEKGTNFAFSRFSDGELFIMQNKKVVLAPGHWQVGEKAGYATYPPEEQKEFIPEKHSEHRKELIEAFQFQHENYYIGLSGRKDVGDDDFEWQIKLRGSDDETNLTFANVFINDNYKRYVHEIVPMLKDRDIIFVVNERALLEGLPFKIKKDFRIGSNCIVNNHDTVEQVRKYIKDNNIKDHVILCGAASLSNCITHKCFEENQSNTFLDVGSTLNPYMGDGMNGWVHTRGYLTHFWLNSGNPYGTQIDVW